MRRQLVYDIPWQKLRISLKGKMCSSHSFPECAKKLKAYINDADSDVERRMRIERVINFLNATRMGYSGQGLLNTAVDDLLLTLRASIYVEFRKYIDVKLPAYDVQAVAVAARQLFEEDEILFERLLKDLENRAALTVQSRGSLDSRKELSEFIDVLRAAKIQR